MSGLSKIGLGTVQWGMPYGIANAEGQPASEEVGNMLRTARQSGICLVDTAAAYGSAEVRLGEWDAASQGFQIVTKTAPLKSTAISDDDLDRIAFTFKQSLQRLKCRQVYGLMVHHAEDLLVPGGERLWQKLLALKSQGLTLKIGVSVYTPDQLSRILDRFAIDVVQLPFNIYDQRFLLTGLMDQLRARGIEIHARSAFLQGLLLIPPEGLPDYFNPIRQHHRRLFDALGVQGLSPLEGSLAFCLAEPRIDRVVLGFESIHQLEQVLGIAGRICEDIGHTDSFALNDEAIINPSLWRR